MTEIVPLNIDNLPERSTFGPLTEHYEQSRDRLIEAARERGEADLAKLEEEYNSASDNIVAAYEGRTLQAAKFGAAIAKANMWREAGLFDRESQQLEMVLQARMDEESSRNPITAIIEEALREAREKAAQSDKA